MLSGGSDAERTNDLNRSFPVMLTLRIVFVADLACPI